MYVWLPDLHILCRLYRTFLPSADSASSQRELSSAQSSLSLSQHQCSHLQAQVDSLKTQLSSRQQELNAVLQSHDQAKEKLGSTGVHMQQVQQESLALKAKVIECCLVWV